jgi:hypothetical protein
MNNANLKPFTPGSNAPGGKVVSKGGRPPVKVARGILLKALLDPGEVTVRRGKKKTTRTVPAKGLNDLIARVKKECGDKRRSALPILWAIFKIIDEAGDLGQAQRRQAIFVLANTEVPWAEGEPSVGDSAAREEAEGRPVTLHGQEYFPVVEL